MEKELKTSPEIGTTCPGLINENYEYHLSGDCNKFCLCMLNNLPCTGRIIIDPEERTSQFFSRGKCDMSENQLKKCPVYGVSKNTFALIVKEKAEKELNEKLKVIGG